MQIAAIILVQLATCVVGQPLFIIEARVVAQFLSFNELTLCSATILDKQPARVAVTQISLINQLALQLAAKFSLNNRLSLQIAAIILVQLATCVVGQPLFIIEARVVAQFLSFNELTLCAATILDKQPARVAVTQISLINQLALQPAAKPHV